MRGGVRTQENLHKIIYLLFSRISLGNEGRERKFYEEIMISGL